MEKVLICPSFEAFVEKKNVEEPFNLSGVIPFESLKENITSPLLENEAFRNSVYVDFNIENNECVDICAYLSIWTLVIQLESSNLIKLASKVLNILKINPGFRFIAVCSDISLWMRFCELTEYNDKVRVCPILSKPVNVERLWAITQMFCVIISEGQFNENGTVKDEWADFLGYLYTRGVIFAFLMTMENNSLNLYKMLENCEQEPLLFAQEESPNSLPPRNFLGDCIRSVLSEKEGNVLIVGNHAIDLIDLCFDCGAKHITTYNKDKFEYINIKAFADGRFPGKCDIILGKKEDVKEISKYDLVLTDCFSDFSFYPEAANAFSANTNVIPNIMKNTIVPIMTCIPPIISQGKACAFKSINPSMAMAISEPKALFSFDKSSSASQSKVVEFKSLVSGVLSGFLCETSIEVVKGAEISIKNSFLIPLSQQIPVKNGETIKIRIDRISKGTEFYFQWCLLSPQFTQLENANGKDCVIKVDI